MLKRCTAAKIQYYSSVSWFLIPKTGDITFAAHNYVNVKKSQIPFHVIFSKVNCKLLCKEFANFKYSSRSPRTLQIICFLDKAYLLNDSSAIDELTVFYLDFEKAFNKVPYDLLLLKIHKMGIGGTALTLIANYLDNRKQCVKINNSICEFRDVTSGVPKRSLLGLLLFLIYITDLPTVASESECFGYADDYKLLSTSRELLESDLISLHNWCVANKVNLHDDKCSLMHFKKQSVVKMNEVAVKPVKVQKDLGVLISNDLSWKENCNLRRVKISEIIVVSQA